MKRLLTLVAFFATLQASAQQVNPVPDYVFANRMSAGRNTVTDTAAYFSIGPRYGATRGMMPPMVVDTASFSANKRNGLLIFSVQKNKFLYWDSVGVKWAEMAGTGGTAISSGDTAAMLSPYVRHAGYGLTKSGQSFLVDTLNIATRAWRQKGLDSLAAIRIGGSGTTNYIPKFTASSTLGNSSMTDNGTTFASTLPEYNFGYNSTGEVSIDLGEGRSNNGFAIIDLIGDATYTDYGLRLIRFNGGPNTVSALAHKGTGPFIINAENAAPLLLQTNNTERIYIFAGGNVSVGNSTDAGYKLDVTGSTRTSTTFTSGAPTNGTAKPWRLGEVATVSPTSPNRTIRVEIDGTVYFIHAKTTND